MPGSSAIEAGRAFLKLFVNDDDFRRGLSTSLRRVEAFGKSLTSIGTRIGAAGAALTAPFVASLKVFASVGSELHDMAKRTGISVESLSELKFAAEQSGTSLQTIARAARQMQANGLDPRTFDQVAARIAAIEDPTKRAQAAFEAFGKRAGSELLPLLGDLDMLRQKARDAGVTMSTEAAAKADQLDDAMVALKASLRGVASAIGEALAPQITRLAEKIGSNTGLIASWIKENAGLVTSLAELTTAVTVFGAVVAGVGKTISGFIGFLRLLSPTGAVIAGAVAGVAALGIAFKDLAQDVKRTFDELEDAPAILGLNPFARFRGAPPPVVGGRGPAAPPELPTQRRGIGSFGQSFGGEPGGGAVRQKIDALRARDIELAGKNQNVFGITMARDNIKKQIEELEGTLRGGILSPSFKFGPEQGGLAAGFFGPLLDPLKVQKALSGILGVSTALSGPTGTFSGRFASQIFGTSGETRAEQLQKKHIAFEAKQLIELQKIARRRAILMGGR